MRGFLIGTVVTALAFAIVTRVLPQFVEPRWRAAPADPRVARVRRRQRRHQADRQAVLAADHGDDARAVQLRDQRRDAAPGRLALGRAVRRHDVRRRVPGRRVQPRRDRRGHRRRRSRSASCPPSWGWSSTTELAAAPATVPTRALAEAARRFGTPVHVTSVPALEAAARELAAAFPDPWLRAFSVKANDVPAIVARLGSLGPRRERRLARRVGRRHRGRDPERADHARGRRQVRRRPAGRRPGRGGRRPAPLGRGGERRGAGRARPAGAAGRPRQGRPPAARRPAPPEPGRPARDPPRARRRPRLVQVRHDRDRAHDGGRRAWPPTARCGRAGSTSTSARSWARWTRGATRCAAASRCSRSSGAGREAFDTFDVGGGFPVGDPGTVPSPARFAAEAAALLEALPADRRPARLAVEPGRFLVAGAGWIVASVLHVRDRPDAEPLVVVDAGMTELIRPALYGATHPIVALTSNGAPVRAVAAAAAVASHAGRRPDLREHRHPRPPRPAAAPPRRPRGDRGDRRVRRLDGLRLQRAPAGAAGPARARTARWSSAGPVGGYACAR